MVSSKPTRGKKMKFKIYTFKAKKSDWTIKLRRERLDQAFQEAIKQARQQNAGEIELINVEEF